jgi:hypothetical protein
MRTLIYKRTHTGDPDRNGWFGIHDCMGRVRTWEFDAVIGVGGFGAEPISHGIDGRVTWIGIGPHKIPAIGGRGPLVTFDRFVLFDARGPSFIRKAPRLSRRLYANNVRVLLHDLDHREQREVASILKLAKHAKRSRSQPASVRGGKHICRRSRRTQNGAWC